MRPTHASSVLDYLDAGASRHPDREVFTFRDRSGQVATRHTWASLQVAVERLAAALDEGGAVRAGERVLLAHPPGMATLVSLLACARIGAIGVPVPLPLRRDDVAMRRLRAIAADCAAAAVLSEGDARERLQAMLASDPLRVLDADAAASAPARPACRQPVLFLQYTSGSTGRPRGVVVSHRNVIANARATADADAIGASWLPQHHDMGLIGYGLFPIVCGGSSHGMAPGDFLRRPAGWLRLIAEVGATHASAPAFGFAYCLQPGRIEESDLEGVDLGCLRRLMSGGEPVQPDVMRRFHARFARFGLRADAGIAAYGLAEATLTVAQGGRRSLCVSRAALRTHLVREAVDDEPSVEIASCGPAVASVEVTIERAPGDEVGEICVSGDSVSSGYWGAPGRDDPRLRTGDLGFVREGELYVCGRRRELLIVAGANVYPDDLEAAVHAGHAVRPRGACAFQTEDGRVVVLAEPEHLRARVDPGAIARDVRRSCGVAPDLVDIVPPRSIALTTSGKLARAVTRATWEAGAIEPLARFAAAGSGCDAVPVPARSWREDLRLLFTRVGVADERAASAPLSSLGVDSLSLVTLQLAVEAVLREHGSAELAESVDAPLLQHLSLNGLLATLAALDAGPCGADAALVALREATAARESETGARMQSDCWLEAPAWRVRARAPRAARTAILLTGATGFFGPFLLHELLRQTDRTICVLVRATDVAQGWARIESALQAARLPPIAPRSRLQVVCGDLAAPRLGLAPAVWETLAAGTAEIFHNGACVNYVLPYAAMHDANVQGTRSVLALAEAAGATVHLVSSTFIFGWSARGILLESECNAAMQGLDFGYAQSKWVAEQLALAARAQGMDVRIYRPALISVSTRGVGDPNDVALRMLAFMLRHGTAVDSANQLSIVAADVLAHNLVGVSRGAAPAVPALHLTADRYYSMTELTRIIERDFGRTFRYFDIPQFIDELNRRCTPCDPVYPLLDFFNRSADKIAAMQLKRYDSTHYRAAKAALPDAREDPALAQTAASLMRCLRDRGWATIARATA